MYNEKYYKMVVWAKEAIEKVIQEQDVDYMLNDVSTFIRSKKECNSINIKAAVATVVCVGGLVNGQFMMPCTKDCLTNFRKVRRDLSKGRKLMVENTTYVRNEWEDYEWTEWIRL